MGDKTAGTKNLRNRNPDTARYGTFCEIFTKLTYHSEISLVYSKMVRKREKQERSNKRERGEKKTSVF